MQAGRAADREADRPGIGGRFRDGSGPSLAAKEATKRRTARASFAIFFGLRRKYLEENVAAIDVKLTEQDLRRINEIFPTGAAAGLRYPEPMMKTING